MRTARRLSQLLFLVLFLLLFLQARYPYEKPPLPADLFLHFSPLVALTTILTTRVFSVSLLVGLVILLLVIPLGRYFCGWICPLGTTIDAADRLFKRQVKRRAGNSSSRPGWKFVILIFLFVTAVLSLPLFWFFDPIALFTRVLTVALYPAFAGAMAGVFNLLFNFGPLEEPAYAVYSWAQTTVLPLSPLRFLNSAPILLFFVAILSLGFFSRRFWCRNLCPLGALFGLFSRFRILRRIVAPACTACEKCQTHCRMAAITADGKSTNTGECILCGECQSACPEKAIAWKSSFHAAGENRRLDLRRRQVIWAGIAGLTGVALLKSQRAGSANLSAVIRPPGAVAEETFLDLCIRCQACSRICASAGGCLQPALFEAGVEGVWSPVVQARLGYCEYNCNLCSTVCPTGAIQPLPLEKKQRIKIGRAVFDKNRCIPWRDSIDCLVCEEHCPLPDKAIKFEMRAVVMPGGARKVVKFPFVVAEACTGCGICETKCPIPGTAGVFITSENNERIKNFA